MRRLKTSRRRGPNQAVLEDQDRGGGGQGQAVLPDREEEGEEGPRPVGTAGPRREEEAMAEHMERKSEGTKQSNKTKPRVGKGMPGQVIRKYEYEYGPSGVSILPEWMVRVRVLVSW